jgi:hypothetical protein
MSGIGSIGMFPYQAVQPALASRAATVDATPSDDGGAAGAAAAGAPSAEVAGDYAMALLAKITRASADQALTLIQGLSAPVGPDGR